MKKIASIMLGMSLLLGTVSVFAQTDTTVTKKTRRSKTRKHTSNTTNTSNPTKTT